ncbi:MAG: DUF1697 domain-containing protein [Acidobacteria bacterium]|nr:DUF1697 domain-containing protein [Acidobacteriota bacterium]
MSRFIAFLRAINVGGHTVRMEDLRRLFESLGFSNVETFIASGNVVFETAAKKRSTLERRIRARLGGALGFEVATFIRTDAELARIADYRPFAKVDLDNAAALNIAFLATPIEHASRKKLMGLRTAIDDFAVHGREIYWLCHRKQSESTFSNAVLERILGRQATLRGANTILRMAEKYRVRSEG